MKIEIDLDDVIRGDDGEPNESVEEAVRRQIVDRLSGDLRQRLFSRIDQELAKTMEREIKTALADRMPMLIDDIMNVTYTPVSSFGERGKPTTFRDAIVAAVAANMRYEPKNSEHDENTFTRAVRSIVSKQTDAIKKELVDRVDKKFAEDALKFAVDRLAERLGLKTAR